MIRLSEIKESILHLFFPQLCAGCGTDLLNKGTELCAKCLHDLPSTRFEKHANNPVEKVFRGRLPIVSGSASFYFTKDSIMQHIMHELKYKGNKELGWQLGKMMGRFITETNRINADALLPLPLFPRKEKQRGYNQSLLLCQGMAEIMGIPILNKSVIRPHHTETQTKKGRIARWQNMEGKFLLKDPSSLAHKHILLVDDVITTGATLESCGQEILKTAGTSLSIATLCISL